jgi:hypothetical protein
MLHHTGRGKITMHARTLEGKGGPNAPPIFFYPRTVIETRAFNKENTISIRKLDLHFRKKLLKCYIWSIVFVVLKIEHFEKYIRKRWNVLKCGAVEGCRRSVGLM